MITQLLQRWTKNFNQLPTVELDYNSFLGFGYVIEDQGEKFFLTKNKIDNESVIEIHTFKNDVTTQSILVPPESLHLALRLIDKIERPVKETEISRLISKTNYGVGHG